jgi:indole-3-glycerol phosphate synthase
MPTILDDILTAKRREVAALAPRLSALKAACREAPAPRSMLAALRRPPGAPVRVIAEIKHKSPSAGVLIEPFDPPGAMRPPGPTPSVASRTATSSAATSST